MICVVAVVWAAVNSVVLMHSLAWWLYFPSSKSKKEKRKRSSWTSSYGGSDSTTWVRVRVAVRFRVRVGVRVTVRSARMAAYRENELHEAEIKAVVYYAVVVGVDGHPEVDPPKVAMKAVVAQLERTILGRVGDGDANGASCGRVGANIDVHDGWRHRRVFEPAKVAPQDPGLSEVEDCVLRTAVDAICGRRCCWRGR
jgi:hypothetical protein